jgi:nucleotide-binding universal stress UspA family protein
MMKAEHNIGLRTRVFGSTSLHLMRKCPCPVWVIKREQRRKFAKVLIAIDPVIDPEEDTEASRDALNIMLLEIGSSLARSEGSELHIFHAWSVLYEKLMQYRAGISTEEIEALRHKTKQSHQQIVDELVGEYAPDVPKNNIHVRRGEAGKLIPKIIQDREIELIVMGTVGRTGISGLLIGNTAEKILNNVDCSVFTVKPDGFISPVQLDD